MNYNEFRQKYINKTIDFDGVYGYQCVDLILQYLNEVYGISKPWVGDAITSSKIGSNTTLNKFFDKTSYTKGYTPNVGDIVIWNPTATNKYGHIGIVDNGTTSSKLCVIEQNASKGDGKGIGRDTVTYREKTYDTVNCFFRYKDFNKIIQTVMTNYKELFEKKYGKSSFFNDMEGAANNLTTPEQIAYFLAIGLERVKDYIDKK